MYDLVRSYAPQQYVAQPKQIGRLPFNLFRSSLASRNPQVAAQAMQQSREIMAGTAQGPVMYLPQSFQFNHWNRMNGGISQGTLQPPGATAQGFMAAMRQSGTARVPRVTGPAPQLLIQDAAMQRGGLAMPQPVTNPGPPILDRRFPSPPPVSGPPPGAIAQQYEAVGQQARRDRQNRMNIATGQVARMQQAIMAITRG